MICFLTSSPMVTDAVALNPENDFVEELRCVIPEDCRMLYICSDPDDREHTAQFGGEMRDAMVQEGLPIADFEILDRQTQEDAQELVQWADLIVLAGGHVPTQNGFFEEIGLRELMEDFDGIVIGISAGSMNSADVVYAQPELEGEAIDPDYPRFLRGLGLTKVMIIPHYQMIRDYTLDGMPLFDGITRPDSEGNCFFILVDGTYLLVRDGHEEIRGEAYVMENGAFSQISNPGDTIPLE